MSFKEHRPYLVLFLIVPLLWYSVYIFVTHDFKHIQEESFLIESAYWIGMVMCLPVAILYPLMPETLGIKTSNVVSGLIGGATSLAVVYLIGRVIQK